MLRCAQHDQTDGDRENSLDKVNKTAFCGKNANANVYKYIDSN